MNTATSHGKNESNRVVSSDKSSEIPWLRLRARIREALTQRNYYVASSEDLGLLWSGERVDATERRRRITVFAAQHQWRVEARADGSTARFQAAPASGLREVLSRNHE
ncbi:MAG: hypothetical protein WDN28_04340 [Chthoniobacter sp.]